MNIGTVVILAFLVFVFILLVRGIRIVPQAHVGAVERLGKFSHLARPGLTVIIPILDRFRPLDPREGSFVDLREQVLDVPPQPVITQDNVAIMVDAVLFYQINDPTRALYEIEGLVNAIRQMAMTNIRNVIGELSLDESLTSRETLNTRLRAVLDEATDKWGVKVTRVELKQIAPPPEIEEAMAKQMKAERDRRAEVTSAEGDKKAQITRAEGERDSAIAEAEGQKRSAILAAEGEREAQISRAEGERQARMLKAQGEAEAINLIFSAIHAGRADDRVIALQYLEALKAIAQSPANKVFIPYDSMKALGAIGAVGEILGQGGGGAVARTTAPPGLQQGPPPVPPSPVAPR